MSIAEMIYAHSRRLPEQGAREALSYIRFLEQRYGVQAPSDVDDTEAFIAAVAGGVGEDFPDDVAEDDLPRDALRGDLD
ncbi:hypothetical protein [Thiohalocapsa sp. ML1]|jgi:hypothetical protein|uniref:hypothetical protein n=1 Tax=Thiohalocapsa sp. ML1 TaxID=1431688 RepID=UPI0007322B4F|nr:hypothetical protein [Thiohalocapsa sp. ML1]